MAVQQLLIRYLLDPLAKIMSRFPHKVKDTCFIAFFLCIIFLYMGRGAGLLDFRYVISYAFGCLGLGGMILCTLPSHIKPVVFRKSLLLIWLGIGALMLLSGILYNVDSLPEALLFLVAYPIIFIVWNQGDSAKIFKQLFRGIEISFWLYALVCLLFFPINAVRYSGLFDNVNGAAGYLALVAVCLLADCLLFEKLTGRRVRKLIALGICVALLLYTGSRTGILELAVAIVTAVVMCLIWLRKQRKHHFFRNLLLIAAAVVLFFNTTMYVLQFGYTAKNGVVSFVQSFFAESFGDTSGDTNPDNNAPTMPSQPTIRPGDSAGLIGDRLDTDGKTLDQISTGRLQIWKGYLKQLNLFGHPDSGTVTISYEGTDKTYHTTHMTVLQIAYENGIIAGILYLVFNLTAGIYSLLFALRHKDEPYAMIPLLICVAYGVYSLLANTGISFWYLCTLMYYLVQFPIMAKPQISWEQDGRQADTR